MFKQGELVQLVSGGPQMVVVSSSGMPLTKDRVEVAWFEPRGQLRRVWLPLRALKYPLQA